MPELRRIPLQVIAFSLFAVCVGYFATMPHYGYGDPASATIKVSLSHAANRVKPCIQMTPEEIAELAANMRRTETCERQRLPLILELDIDNEPVLRLDVPPSGLWGDGPASIYERFDVAPGAHLVAVRLRDTARTGGWDYERADEVFLEAGRYFTVTFEAETGGFIFR